MTLYGGGYEQGENSARGALTVTARVSNGSSRHAMPTLPELVYAALLYKDGASPANKDFAQGTAAENGKLIFSFQRPSDTSGTFTLEIFAFVKTDVMAEDGTTNFSKETALLSGSKTGCKIEGDKIIIDKAIPLSSDKQGTVNLKIKVPDGCSLELKELKIDGTTESKAHFAITGTSPNFTVKQNDENEILAGAYQVQFTVKKGTEIIHIFSEYINVINGLCTDTWSGLEKDEAKEITQGMISSTVYVRGTGESGWYETSPYKDTATASDTNSGSFLSPLATIQKAVDKIIAINDGESAYTIYIDGTLDGTTAAYLDENGMADFSALTQNLTLTITALSGTATLDGGAVFDANGNVTAGGIGKRVINAAPASGKLNLTLVNLTVTGGNASDNGGGIYFDSTSGTLTISDGTTIKGNTAGGDGGGVYVNVGKFTMTAGTISGNTATNEGGGICLKASNTLKISGSATISGNKAKYGGGIAKDVNGSIEMDGGEISGNTATGFGGGIYSNSGGSLKISGGTIKENEATQSGGGIYHWSASSVTISGGATISGNTAKNGGGMYVGSSLYVKGGAISGNTATNEGGGIFFNSPSAHEFKISGGTIGGASDSDKNTAKNGGGVYANAWKPTMSGGTISGNIASENGGGVYVTVTGTFTMSGSATISGNTASSGGGIYNSKGTFAMTGGTISGNTATNGNGAYLAATGKLNMSDAAQFAESDDVYLYASGSNIPTITVAGALNAESLPVATITPSAYTAGTQVLTKGTDASAPAITQDVCGKFAVSQEGWEIVPNDDGTAGVLGLSIYLNSSSGDDANSGLTASKAVKTLSKAIELFESQGAQKIMVCAAYTLPSGESTLLDRAGKEHLTLVRYTGSSDGSDKFTGTLLTISQGNVTITNVTLDGTIKGYRTDELLSISGSGTEVTLGDDAIICNNSDSGVCVSSYNGKFKMTGGAITGNRTSFGGGGVNISSGTFEMSGGIISGNSGGSSGGGVDVGTGSGCKFTMRGGEISGNYASIGAGVNVSNGMYAGTFEMIGGTISGNQSYGTGDGKGGGGVYVSGKFTMSGGEITGNTATTNGGGVYVKTGGTFTQGGTVSGNTPDDVYTAP